MDNHERMLTGRVYDPNEARILAEQAQALELLYDYNSTRPSQQDERARLLPLMFGALGKTCYFEPPLHANWGGRHVFVGDSVYANFNLTLVDDGDIYIGSNTMFGPNVVVATAGHPILPELRARGLQYNLPVHIGSNVWIGGGAQIMPGLTIGDDTVIGAGSVVTRDLPSGVVAVGVPCRVLRQISDHDSEFYWQNRRLDD
ncbi:galactoside O-acetyltransferase [Arthrobacter sp. PL16]|uniref:sugar O-acetyltransferase n=1 Tax=Arthrobacter sp. PL16 TaxID=3071720 RepID=UPI002DFF50EC|nr:galactoside O-acetyltransferase [Arthrobacter sp. PL16]